MTTKTSKTTTRARTTKPGATPANRNSMPRKAAPTDKHPAGTKQDRVLAMLRAKAGATVAAIIKATGWQEHTVRAFFSAVVRKRLGLTMETEKKGDERVHRIVAAKPTRRVRAAKGK